jgi:hypothetical protein
MNNQIIDAFAINISCSIHQSLSVSPSRNEGSCQYCIVDDMPTNCMMMPCCVCSACVAVRARASRHPRPYERLEATPFSIVFVQIQ